MFLRDQRDGCLMRLFAFGDSAQSIFFRPATPARHKPADKSLGDPGFG